ncbi:uncharacterized protein [Ptychodera flava]|uniref:uncharacterized protein isoform X2 n=1 Tax=Ptychodera flava TaxID=63121 RepID=UPI00396A3977
MDSLGLSDLVGKLMPLQSSLLPRLKSNVPPIVLETRNLVKPGSQMYERRWGLVQSSLYVLHNLARAAPNRHFFNNTEAKRVLHIYAGSDAIGRYLPAMLALSYVVETENEFDLIKDERELITTITNELEKIVSGSESGFSLDELLEGFENLSMNQENKKKIVAMAVPVLVQSKEKCDKHEKADISRILVKLGSVEKDDVQSDKSTDDKSESVAVKDAALSGTLASLKSAVDDLRETSKDSFNEVKEKLDSMNEAATKFQRKERRVIVSGFVDISGSVDILMELARYYYGNGGDALYRDGNRWEALNSLVNVFWNYTDASKSFAAAAGEAGLVKFLLDVCDNHYQLLKTKILALSDLIGKYHGDEPQHSQAKVHKSKQPVPEPKTAAKPTETKSEKENQDVSGIGSKSLLFKGLGVRAGIKDGGRVAYRIDAEHAANDKAVFVTNKPLPTGTLFEIQIDRMDQNKPETLEFGVTMYQEFPDDVFYHGDGYGQGQGFWFLRGTDFYKDFERIGGGYKWNLNKLSEGDRVGIARHPNSALHYYYNGEDMGMAFRNIPQDVYPLTAVTGKCLQVSIADPPSDFAIPKDSASEAEFVEPFERFRFTTGTRHTEEFSRMRTPFGQDFIDKARYPRQAEIYAKPVAADSPEMG